MTDIPVLETHLRRVLQKMGTSSKSIAAYLATRCVIGKKEEPFDCPVANYLKTEYPGKVHISVTNPYVELQAYGQEVTIRTPVMVLEFVKDFDDGKYPELEQLTPPSHPDEE